MYRLPKVIFVFNTISINILIVISTKKWKIHTEPQKTLSTQSNLEKEESKLEASHLISNCTLKL